MSPAAFGSLPLWQRGARWPERIVCLTEETTETLFLLGAGDRVVGVSGYTVRPPEARKRPKVSSFLDANFDRIAELKPDLVIGFSDLQATLGAELCRRGIPVVLFNQRSLAEVLATVRMTGALVGLASEAEVLAQRLEGNLARHAEAARALPRRPRVFFEEWGDPLISGIRWVSELLEVCGADDVFPHTRTEQGAKGRIVTSEQVQAAAPELLIASWCGKKANQQAIRARPGWEAIPALRDDQLYEVKSTYVLQPGPASLTDGLDQLARIVHAAAHGTHLPRLRASDLRRADLEPAG